MKTSSARVSKSEPEGTKSEPQQAAPPTTIATTVTYKGGRRTQATMPMALPHRASACFLDVIVQDQIVEQHRYYLPRRWKL